jgi:hypothetical protein
MINSASRTPVGNRIRFRVRGLACALAASLGAMAHAAAPAPAAGDWPIERIPGS